MEIQKTATEWRPVIIPILDSKREEFLMMGYPQATSESIWSCLVDRVWKGNPTIRLHEVVQDVLHLNASIYMSFLTVNAYKDNDDLMASIAALTGGDA